MFPQNFGVVAYISLGNPTNAARAPVTFRSRSVGGRSKRVWYESDLIITEVKPLELGEVREEVGDRTDLIFVKEKHLKPGELNKGGPRGLRWEDYDGSELRVKHSVWRSHVGEPKSPKSQGTIPAIAPLRVLLDRHRARCGGPSCGFIFSSAKGQPMNLEALAIDVVRPALEKAGLNWHGWHAFRRGLATNLHRLGVSDKVIQQILRHANVTTTMNIYVKTATADAANAMKTLGTICATAVQLMGLESSRLM